MQIWSRAEKISAAALAISMFAIAITVSTELRGRQSDRRGAEAVAVAVGNKVRTIANDSELAGKFIQGFINHAKKYPQEADLTELLAIDFLAHIEFPELTVSSEHLVLLAHVDSDAASKLANCAERRAIVETDVKKLAGIKRGKLANGQRLTVNVLPYRLRELSEACSMSLNSLVLLVPQLPSIMGPIRGTIGELIEAQRSAAKEIAAGADMKLKIR